MKERENRWFPQGVCESAGEVTELSEKKRRLGKHKLTFPSFLPVPHITPWHGLTPPHTHKNTNTPLQEHSNSGKVQQPPKFQHMTQIESLVIWPHRICVQLSGWLITRFLEMCEGSQTTTHVIEPVCSHIQPDRPSCCNLCSFV